MEVPTVGRVVIYHQPVPLSELGFDVPAIVTGTETTVQEARVAGLEHSTIRSLSSPEHLHLTVLTPHMVATTGVAPVRNVAPATDDGPKTGTWRWPERPSAEGEAPKTRKRQVTPE